MRKFCLMRKHNDNNLSFLHNFIIINHNDKKNLSFNYKLLDDFDVTKWIDDYNKYTELINKAESAITKPIEKMTSEEVKVYLAGKK